MSFWSSMVKNCTPTRYDLLLTRIYIAIICSVNISKAILARCEYLEALINDGSQHLQQVVSIFSKL
jgi:hypothetical protein